MLKQSNPAADNVGKNWPYNFIKCLGPKYRRVKQKPMDPKQLAAEDIGIIETWYDWLKIQLELHNITPDNLYNFDETGFRIG